MKSIFLLFLVSCCVFLNIRSIYAQPPNISIEMSNRASANVDSAKSVFGLNELYFSVANSSLEGIKIRYKESEIKFGNNNWVTMPEINYTIARSENITLRANDSLLFRFFIPLYNFYYDTNFNMESLLTSGGIIDYRVVFAVKYGSTDSTLYSPVVHIIVPPATVQDVTALNYVIQQKFSCPELENFFAFYNSFSLNCSYAYEHLSTNFPESALGKVARYKISIVKCRDHRSELNAMPEIKAAIINTRNMLLVSDIPYLKYISGYLSCE